MTAVFSTCDLLDAHEAAQSCHTQFRLFGKHRRFHGRIRTAICPGDNSFLKQMVGTKSEGEVLVVDGGGSLACALLGDMMAQKAVDNGWAGIVVFGAIRDSDVVDTLELGVKALGTNPRKSAKNQSGAMDVPIHFGGVTFESGLYLYSDADGIIVAKEPLL